MLLGISDALSLSLLCRSSFISSIISATVPLFVTEAPRVPDIGGGYDIMSSSDANTDSISPVSLLGRWSCERTIISSDGDQEQAEMAFTLLGGGRDTFRGKGNTVEVYESTFVKPPTGSEDKFTYPLDGSQVVGVILDRGQEIRSRKSDISDIVYDPLNFNHVSYVKGEEGQGGKRVDIDAVSRQVFKPSEKGWGSNELLRVTTQSPLLYRAIKVSRRYRRGYEGEERIVEGIEIVKTYRVIDGIAGVEVRPSEEGSDELTTQ